MDLSDRRSSCRPVEGIRQTRDCGTWKWVKKGLADWIVR
jgi:hypothetical protein